MKKYSIKICRVSDIHTARFLARCKIDFIGFHAIFGVPSQKQTLAFKNIIKELQTYYPDTKTVLVTRIKSVKKLLKVYKEIPADFVQWSASIAKSDKMTFVAAAKKINPRVKLFNVISSTENDISTLRKNIVGKYVIIDKDFKGGTGTLTPKKTASVLTKLLGDKYILLAGGMGRVDIKTWLANISVSGVDIMSSMEVSSTDNRKDISKIARYLRENRGDQKLPILKLPLKKNYSYRKVSTVRGAMRALNKNVDYIILDDTIAAEKLALQIMSRNPFVSIKHIKKTPSAV